MADNKRKRGKADRRTVAGRQKYEIAYIAKKYGVKPALIREIIRLVGNRRKAVYAMIVRATS